MRKILTSAIFAVTFITNSAMLDKANADQDGTFGYDEQVRPQNIQAPPLQKGSNASFDSRLPPVLPGEVVNDGHSKTRVWSTAGSVSSGAVPNAPSAPQNGTYQGGNAAIGGVIVDDRGIGNRRSFGR